MTRFGLRASLAGLFMAAGLLAAGAASAGPLMPATAAAAEKAAPAAVQAVNWVCGPYRCYWRPGVRYVVPPYAVAPPYAVRWGAPRYPWCYWTKVRGPYGAWRWVHVCN